MLLDLTIISEIKKKFFGFQLGRTIRNCDVLPSLRGKLIGRNQPFATPFSNNFGNTRNQNVRNIEDQNNLRQLIRVAVEDRLTEEQTRNERVNIHQYFACDIYQK